MHADVVIIGGGIIGSSIAYHLAQSGSAVDVVVIEKDPTYEHAATPRSNGGIRRLFSLPENIHMASFGLEFYRDFATNMSVDSTPVDIAFARQGYLFISDRGGREQMEQNFALQSSLGVDVDLLSPSELAERFPSVSTQDVVMAVHSYNDAWIDPYAALMGFKAKARSLGVTYIAAEVVDLERDHTAVRSARLRDGQSVSGQYFVNACGAWCAPLARTVGLELPVEPMSRESYFVKCPRTIEPLPFLKTESDLAFRPDADGFVGGLPDWAEPAGWNFDASTDRFEAVVWPALAARIPAMETLRLERSWRGHYARSQLDLSPIIGPWEGGLENFYLANGFSGHGIMHAPATGRAIAEMIVTGQSESIDISRFGYSRVRDGKPYREKGIV